MSTATPMPGRWRCGRGWRRASALTPEMVLCTNGSDEMVLLLCLAFLREGDQAVMAHGIVHQLLLAHA